MTSQDLEQVNTAIEKTLDKTLPKVFAEFWEHHLEPAFTRIDKKFDEVDARFDVQDMKIDHLTDALQLNGVLSKQQTEHVKDIKYNGKTEPV